MTRWMATLSCLNRSNWRILQITQSPRLNYYCSRTHINMSHIFTLKSRYPRPWTNSHCQYYTWWTRAAWIQSLWYHTHHCYLAQRWNQWFLGSWTVSSLCTFFWLWQAHFWWWTWKEVTNIGYLKEGRRRPFRTATQTRDRWTWRWIQRVWRKSWCV